jgi:hypothetical protein
MRYIALEEAFSIAGLGKHLRQMPLRPKKEYAESWQTKLADFTEYRLPEMDAAGIDIQVLSLTVPGLQIDIDEGDARERARGTSAASPDSASAGRWSTITSEATTSTSRNTTTFGQRSNH